MKKRNPPCVDLRPKLETEKQMIYCLHHSSYSVVAKSASTYLCSLVSDIVMQCSYCIQYANW